MKRVKGCGEKHKIVQDDCKDCMFNRKLYYDRIKLMNKMRLINKDLDDVNLSNTLGILGGLDKFQLIDNDEEQK